MTTPVNIFWFRRDLRLDDNHGLYQALQSKHPVLPIFILDSEILDKLDKNDSRVHFIHQTLINLNGDLQKSGSNLQIVYGQPNEVWKNLINKFNIKEVFANHDYEPYAIKRDQEIANFLSKKDIQFKTFKDQVIFEKGEVAKDDGKPYTVYTPYMKKWMARYQNDGIQSFHSRELKNFFLQPAKEIPSLSDLGFVPSTIQVRPFRLEYKRINSYENTRDIPALHNTSLIGPHLRFGTISIREAIRNTEQYSITYLKELVWREFFMQILYHFPQVVGNSFKPKYERIDWINDEDHFELWCKGKTGYPMVDAGMRQLNKTGFMHNRVRMVTASFLCKHLLVDWRWGEAYFAKKLLDYELSSNNGNWQWAAGSGCDAAPYFRVFNPFEQQKKFDKDFEYIKKWVPEFGTADYPQPIIEHKFARERAIKTYKKALD